MIVAAPAGLGEIRELARASPGGLGLATDPTFLLPPHLDLLDSKLVRFLSEIARKCEVSGLGPIDRTDDRRGPRLMVMMPPGHGKSMLVSQLLPAWALGCFPRMRIIVASYDNGLATAWGRRARELLEEHGGRLFGVGISTRIKAASEWETLDGGSMLARGVGSGITGRRAEVLIVDDPVKDQEQALSKAIREKAWDWWRSTARTRLAPGAGAVLVMTRWHEDDLAGRLLRQDAEGEGEGWEVLSYPAIAEEADDVGRSVGDALWPAMFDRAYLDLARAVSSEFWFSAMYQQRPGPAEGSILKRADVERFYPPLSPPRLGEVCQSWDLAFKERAGGSYVVGQAWGADRADRYLLGQIRARLDFNDTLAAIRAMTAWLAERGFARPGEHRIYVEDAANGPAVISALRREIAGLRPVRPEGSKESRVHAVSPQFESGNVRAPEGFLPAPPDSEAEERSEPARWGTTRAEDYVEELVNFPVGLHDDQVDAMSQALVRMRSTERRQRKPRAGGYA